VPPIRHWDMLEVNLSTGGIAPRGVSEEMMRRYLGGSGLAARMLYDGLDPSVDPLAPEAPLVVMNGLLTGSPVICCNKVCLCARSPLTGIWGESRAGGFFGAELARTGIGGVVFRGQAPEPVYLWINGSAVARRSAADSASETRATVARRSAADSASETRATVARRSAADSASETRATLARRSAADSASETRATVARRSAAESRDGVAGYEGTIELRPARHVWGRDTFETGEMLRAETDPKAQVGAIGPAGEALVRFACVMFGGRDARAAGRTGMGAVMGAKRLKAIVVRGQRSDVARLSEAESSRHGVADSDVVRRSAAESCRHGVADSDVVRHSAAESCRHAVADHRLLAAMRAENPKARDDAGRLREFGTAGGVIVVEAAGDLPVKNWQLGSWEDRRQTAEGRGQRAEKRPVERIAPQTHFARTLKGHYACFGCPIRCGKTIRTPAGDIAHAPEYETTAGFGPLLLNDDLDTIFAANELCNRYGLDTISTAAVVAFAMEAAERGVLSAPSADRSDGSDRSDRSDRSDGSGRSHPDQLRPHPKWGDGAAILALIHQIARREGIGRLLGEGVRRAAEAFGPEAASFAIHTKGLEYPFHDPRAFISMAPDYATGSRGGCHLESFSYILGYGSPMPDFGIERGGVEPHEHEGAARIAVLMQNLMTVFDALGMCKFVARNGTGPGKLAHWLSLATGWDVSADELMAAGERLFNLKRAYNLRCGIRGKDDRLPDRLEHLDRKTGGAAGSLPDMARLLPEYYALRGWDARGFPTAETLRRLGLDDIVADLGQLG